MEKILIYPYNKCYEAVAKCRNLPYGNEIASLVSPNGWGLIGEEVISDEVSLKIEQDFTSELNKCTLVWFVEDDKVTLPRDLLASKIEETVNNNKKIIFTRYKSREEFLKWQHYILPELNVTSHYMKDYKDTFERKACYDLATPVVTVLGVEENTDKFAVQVAIITELRKRGYSVSGVSSRADSDVIGIHSFPLFMFEHSLTEAEKIIKFNHVIRAIEVNEKPDIIVVGIPGGALEFDNVNHNNYGVIAYEISKAVSSDFGVVCIPYLEQMNGNYQTLSDEISGRFKIPVDVFHIAAVAEDVMELNETSKRSFITLDRDFINRKINSYNNNTIVNVLNGSDCEKVVNKIIEVLSVDEIDVV